MTTTTSYKISVEFVCQNFDPAQGEMLGDAIATKKYS